jgi:hypothetical protein
MILSIFEHTPVWIWVLFFALLALGIAQTRTRNVNRARVTVLPVVMIVLSFSGVLSSFSQVPLAFVAWIAGFCALLALAGSALAVRGASWSTEKQIFTIPGSCLPVTLIFCLFVTKYVAAVWLAMNPALAANPRVAVSLSLLYGVLAGLFWARARSLRALTRTVARVQPA